MKRIIINIAGFQVGWLASILGGSAGLYWLGPAVVAAVVSFHLALQRDRARELRVIVPVAIIGAIVDTAFHATDVLRLNEAGAFNPVFIPWILGFWINFAATISTSFRWLEHRLLIASVLALVSAPGTYYAGDRLGALLFHPDQWITFTAVAVEWAIMFPLMLIWSRRLRAHEHTEAA